MELTIKCFDICFGFWEVGNRLVLWTTKRGQRDIWVVDGAVMKPGDQIVITEQAHQVRCFVDKINKNKKGVSHTMSPSDY